MKLLVLSDLHLEFSDLVLPEHIDFDIAILAGDIVCPGSKVAAWVVPTDEELTIARHTRALLA